MWDKLEALHKRYNELTQAMADPAIALDYQRMQVLAREVARLEDVVALYKKYQETQQALASAKSVFQETDEADLKALARDELDTLLAQREGMEQEIRLALLPKDPRDEKDVIIEVRSAAGGEEAALFAADLFRMYNRYAERRDWRVDVIASSETDLGGFKEIIFEIKGQGAYSRLKHESGSHRVQRVPTTETGGRLHTSTATVAVLPKAEEVDIDIADSELRIDIFHAGGHGGQNVNKVATAVRITHLPTGMVVVCQDERSQLKNKTKAMAVLRSRLLAMERQKREEEITEARRSQVGSGDRSEKIRTYNFPQDRLTDHRIGLTVHNLQAVLDGDLDDIIDSLITQRQAELLQASAAV